MNNQRVLVMSLSACLMLCAAWVLLRNCTPPKAVSGVSESNSDSNGPSADSYGTHERERTPETPVGPGAASIKREKTTADQAEDSRNRIRLVVLAEDGEPVPGAQVLFQRGGKRGTVYVADGHGRIDRPAEVGRGGQLVVLAEGYLIHAVKLENLATKYNRAIVLQRDVGYRVQIVSEESALPIAGAEVRPLRYVHETISVTKWTQQKIEEHYADLTGKTDQDGQVRVFGIGPGSWHPLRLELADGSIRIARAFIDQLNLGARNAPDPIIVAVAEEMAAIEVALVDETNSPRSGVMVTLICDSYEFAGRSDNNGLVEISLPFAVKTERNTPDYIEVKLSEGRYWTDRWRDRNSQQAPNTRSTIQVAWRPIAVRLKGEAGGDYSVASASALIPQSPPLFGFQPRANGELQWFTLASDRITNVNAGWQGKETCVVLRDDNTNGILAAAPVDKASGQAILFVPAMCEVRIQYAGKGVTWAGAQLILEPTLDFGRDTIRLPLRGQMGLVHVPQEEYQVRVELDTGRLYLKDKLDATGRRAVLQLPETTFIELRGQVQSALDEGVPGAEIRVISMKEDWGSQFVTGANGVFASRVPARQAFFVRAYWPKQISNDALDDEYVEHIVEHPEREPIVITLEDSMITLRANNTEAASVGEYSGIALAQTDEEGNVTPFATLHLRPGETLNYRVPSGRYSVQFETATGPTDLVLHCEAGKQYTANVVVLPLATVTVKLKLLGTRWDSGRVNYVRLQSAVRNTREITGRLDMKTAQEKGVSARIPPGDYTCSYNAVFFDKDGKRAIVDGESELQIQGGTSIEVVLTVDDDGQSTTKATKSLAPRD